MLNAAYLGVMPFGANPVSLHMSLWSNLERRPALLEDPGSIPGRQSTLYPVFFAYLGRPQ